MVIGFLLQRKYLHYENAAGILKTLTEGLAFYTVPSATLYQS